ncbi:hypothetical protein SAMN04489761_3354 [Tenacibaculum sp. MAR_2009_124]|uniref:hypothetical protein n=1 Tax=Tenacibaculum sp. MAR_2009_124 TaxID=1250059 RepID=UPI000899FA8A|nr:hypothetical protein [Tenacibaculum sp. MAR_2009_124]SEC57026.1 hypothetical protein SAMN04489761_3354 [Tenacibaculum sp. MAR_2009_124]
MKLTTKILEYLKIDKRLILLYKKEIDIPIVDDSFEPFTDEWFEHPPMLVPLFVDYDLPLLNGLIVYPFSEKKNSLGSFYLESDQIIEKARTIDQFVTSMIVEMIVAAGGMQPEIEEFCENLGYNKRKEVNDFVEKYGNIPKYFGELIFFTNELPLYYCKDIESYKGDYLSSKGLLNFSVLEKSNPYELYDQSLLSNLDDIPKWLDGSYDSKVLFNSYMEIGDLEKAWYVLNSKDLDVQDIAKGLMKMKSVTENRIFNLIADNWLLGYNTKY